MLLEFGVICIVTCIGNHQGLFLMRWLLLRLLFHSGYKKLESGCPTWWRLTALDWHFESQCIPTPLAYYAHHMPKLFLKFGVAFTYITQMGVSLLCLSPNRRLRIFGAWCHIFHQIGIMATGNYNFFNLLTILISVACFDDAHIDFLTRAKKSNTKAKETETYSITGVVGQILVIIIEIVQLTALAYVIDQGVYFDLEHYDISLQETAEDQSKLHAFMRAILKPAICLVNFKI